MPYVLSRQYKTWCILVRNALFIIAFSLQELFPESRVVPNDGDRGESVQYIAKKNFNGYSILFYEIMASEIHYYEGSDHGLI